MTAAGPQICVSRGIRAAVAAPAGRPAAGSAPDPRGSLVRAVLLMSAACSIMIRLPRRALVTLSARHPPACPSRAEFSTGGDLGGRLPASLPRSRVQDDPAGWPEGNDGNPAPVVEVTAAELDGRGGIGGIGHG